jgi:glycine/serine hydroxymethyltransferase
MDILMSSMKKLTNKIILLDKFNGGHSKTAAIAKENNYNVAYLTLEFESWDIDYTRLAILIEKWKDEVVFIYIDHTVVLNPLDIHKLLSKIPPQWITYYDISHLQLFYFSKTFTFSAKSNFFFGGSTHKSFPGPQKAIILLNNNYLYKTIKSGFESAVSSTHTGSILALLITVIEMERYGAEYAKDIIHKTRLFAKKLSEKLNVVGPSPNLTNTHQICIAVKNPMEITKRLASVGIITAPSRKPLVKSIGLRLGIQEHCRMGINERNLIRLAEIISNCIGKNRLNTFKIKQEVEKIAKSLTRVKYVLNTSQVLQLMEQ